MTFFCLFIGRYWFFTVIWSGEELNASWPKPNTSAPGRVTGTVILLGVTGTHVHFTCCDLGWIYHRVNNSGQ